MIRTPWWLALLAISCQGDGQPVPDFPTVARDDHVSISEDGELALFRLTDNDDAADYNPISWDPPLHGSIERSSLGGLVYRPNPGFHGRVELQYSYSDGPRATAYVEVVSDGIPYEEGSYLIETGGGGDVELADVDADGRLDVVVLNERGSDVAIGLNRTTEIRDFELLVRRFEAGRRPSALGVGDLDGDGLVDIVSAARDDGELVILAGRDVDPLSFAAPLRLATDPEPNDLELADVNGDGLLDIVSISASAANLSVILNQSVPGEVAFGERFVFDAPEKPVALTTADFDGDGIDVAVVGAGGDLAIYANATAIGDTVPAFERQLDRSTGAGPVAVVAADLDGDGGVDLAVANHFDATLWVARNESEDALALTAAGVFALSNRPRTLLPFTSEAGVDLAVAGDDGIRLMRSAGDLSFASRTIRLGLGTRSLSTFGFDPAAITRGDLDGDGIDELVFGLETGFDGAVLIAYDRPER
jgi:hypothetical protein